MYENLTRIDPGDPGTFTSLAWAYHVLYQNDAKAMQSLDQAFAVDETYYEAWLVLGRIQEAKGETSEAIAAYWKAVKGNRADVQALGRLGSLYDESGNAAGAARAAFELVQRAPDSADAKSAFAAVGLGITLDRATIEGRQAKLAWTITGKRVAESYRLVLVRPNWRMRWSRRVSRQGRPVSRLPYRRPSRRFRPTAPLRHGPCGAGRRRGSVGDLGRE